MLERATLERLGQLKAAELSTLSAELGQCEAEVSRCRQLHEERLAAEAALTATVDSTRRGCSSLLVGRPVSALAQQSQHHRVRVVLGALQEAKLKTAASLYTLEQAAHQVERVRVRLSEVFGQKLQLQRLLEQAGQIEQRRKESALDEVLADQATARSGQR